MVLKSEESKKYLIFKLEEKRGKKDSSLSIYKEVLPSTETALPALAVFTRNRPRYIRNDLRIPQLLKYAARFECLGGC